MRMPFESPLPPPPGLDQPLTEAQENQRIQDRKTVLSLGTSILAEENASEEALARRIREYDALTARTEDDIVPERFSATAAKQQADLFLDRDNLQRLVDILEKNAVTGLMNRAALEINAPGILREYLENKTSFAFAALDLNSLKAFNTFGWAIGDRFLRLTADIFKSVLPKNTVICHYGGDEFVFLLPNVSDIEADQILETAKQNLGEHTYRWLIAEGLGEALPPEFLNEKDPDSLLAMLKEAGISIDPWRIALGILDEPLSLAAAPAIEIPYQILEGKTQDKDLINLLTLALADADRGIKEAKRIAYEEHPATDMRTGYATPASLQA